mmetsp:Transcript_3378/g.13031  ORF Transcript_3378/g.13031 Transcript_3378/m.13031 type:complete len:126 (+) Transcript_3378:1399-1776(+)
MHSIIPTHPLPGVVLLVLYIVMDIPRVGRSPPAARPKIAPPPCPFFLTPEEPSALLPVVRLCASPVLRTRPSRLSSARAEEKHDFSCMGTHSATRRSTTACAHSPRGDPGRPALVDATTRVSVCT